MESRTTSPRLDALAKEGVLFEDALTPSPWTLPSHASMLTGLYPSRHRLISHSTSLPTSVTSITSLLAANGFATAAVVNSHNLSPTFGLHRDFEDFEYVKEVVGSRETSRNITDHAIEWLRRYREQRLFLFIHYYDVHSDYLSLPEYERQFVGPYQGIADGTTKQMVAVRSGKAAFDQEDARHLIDLYDAGIRQMDDEIARLLTEVGGADDTLLIVTSDHGEEFLEHGGVLHGRTQFEEVMRVPMIVRGAGAPAGLRVPTTVSLIDIMPTILTAVGIPVPTGLDGSDLAPTWRGGGTELGGRYFFGEADHNNAEPDVTRAVRHYKDKLHFDRLTRVQTLFDLRTDPGERVDVAANRPEVVARLREQLDHFQQGPATGNAVNLTPEQIEKLRSLGYVP
jgi:arylsulfatase A-like enzyme